MPMGVVKPTAQATPETYVGLARAERFDPPPQPGTHTYAAPRSLDTSHFALSGTWQEGAEAGTAVKNAEIHAQIAGKDAYLVLSPPQGGSGSVSVLLDGRQTSSIRVDRQRLYHLVSNPRPERHGLTLRFSPGVQAYAFTFG